MIRVGVNGYGVIGRRIADAIAAQPDMKLEGVTKVKPDYKASLALEKKYRVYAAMESSVKEFEKEGIELSGSLTDLLKNVDLVIDASPDEIGAKNKESYVRTTGRAIFQGGEEPDVADVSFVAQCNFEKATGKSFVRIVSCNTTALCRALHTIDEAFGVTRARAVIARRAADPDETGKGPIDAVVLDPVQVPSHHAGDVRTVLPRLKIVTMALKIPTTHMHLHSLILSLEQPSPSEDKVIEAFEAAPRILLVEGKKGFKSTGHVVDYARELGRPRSDLYEAIVWRDSLKILDGELHLYMGVHQEAIVIPENVDAVRAVMNSNRKEDSMKLTNRTLGISH